NVLAAFQAIYMHGKELSEAQPDFFYSLESRRRLNNLVYYASLVLEACPGPEGFEALGLGEAELRQMLARLVPEGIDQIPEIGVIHTVGAAYAALGEKELAAQAGNRFLEVAKESEDARELSDVLADAFMWIQGASALGQ